MKGFVVFIFLSAAALLSAQEAYIREIIGTVEVKNPGTTAWSPARVGQRISGGTSIATRFRSRAVIVLGSSLLDVLPLTSMTLQEIQTMAEKEQTSIYLRTGRVRVDVKPPA
jgi:hypothetical protein